MDRIQRHREICEELNDVYAKKNHDYGNSFGDTFEKLGIISAITRISDKYNRLVSLCTKSEEERKVKDESITDTLLDMANYCIMTVIEMHREDNCEHDWKYIGQTSSGNQYICEKCRATKTLPSEDSYAEEDWFVETQIEE